MTSETVGPGASDTLEAQSWSVDPVIRFDRIHVIESLPETGRSFRTGAQLFEELEAFCSSTPVVPVFHLVNTGLELFEVLRSCVEEARAGHYPLLHFETHGVERAPGRSTTSIGLSLASGEVVRWPVLGGYLTEINEATRLNLLVFMAACYGADVVTLIRPPSRAPARVVVGPMRPVYVPEIFPATREFYRSMLRDGDGEQAVLAMNRAISKERPTFFRLRPSGCLCTSWRATTTTGRLSPKSLRAWSG